MQQYRLTEIIILLKKSNIQTYIQQYSLTTKSIFIYNNNCSMQVYDYHINIFLCFQQILHKIKFQKQYILSTKSIFIYINKCSMQMYYYHINIFLCFNQYYIKVNFQYKQNIFQMYVDYFVYMTVKIIWYVVLCEQIFKLKYFQSVIARICNLSLLYLLVNFYFLDVILTEVIIFNQLVVNFMQCRHLKYQYEINFYFFIFYFIA
eukprot:TRINITY_DN449_c1_g2_i2.p1 TRINITY_DN449_c1_g2~~TRINITY_DN449_c1_g2_i2.p1  ORF type:complete len:205 (-),score=-25.51 TRINITY_DN449_c1_g2_i2:99-713(-)